MEKFSFTPEPIVWGQTKLDKELYEIGISFTVMEKAECGHEPSRRKVLAGLKKLKKDTPENRRFYSV